MENAPPLSGIDRARRATAVRCSARSSRPHPVLPARLAGGIRLGFWPPVDLQGSRGDFRRSGLQRAGEFLPVQRGRNSLLLRKVGHPHLGQRVRGPPLSPESWVPFLDWGAGHGSRVQRLTPFLAFPSLQVPFAIASSARRSLVTALPPQRVSFPVSRGLLGRKRGCKQLDPWPWLD